ncbi:uncharacterized protein [Rutidosis leptorrhynchoides]|uniref:uncharacterized protein n=1 Tax=Rutidosis leptorrhynchoides TaxID=125765 RepID=UPI003A99251B
MDASIHMDAQQQLITSFPYLSIHHSQDCDFEPEDEWDENQNNQLGDENCAICLDKIALKETALVKGCEHAYCVICILRWAASKKEATCPQCNRPFEFLNVHRSLDGSIHDYMFEESVCLLLRAPWFHSSNMESPEVFNDHVLEEFYRYEYEQVEYEQDPDEVYVRRPSNINIPIGNRRCVNNGKQNSVAGSSSSDVAVVGRRAKRALKREAADKAAAEKPLQHLVRLRRNV